MHMLIGSTRLVLKSGCLEFAANDGNAGCLPVRVAGVEQLVATLSWSLGQAGTERWMHWRLHRNLGAEN